MRHRKAGLKLSRKTAHLKSLFRNLVTSLLKYDRIRTTDTKAKELRRWADHLVTLAKRGDLHARRQALALVQEPAVVHKLFDKAAERFGKISGGYTRITKLGFRPGDAAPVTLVEFIDSEGEAKKKKSKKKAAKAAAGKKKAAAKAPEVKPAAEETQPAGAEEKPAEAEAKPKRAPRKKAAAAKAPAKKATAKPAKKPTAKKKKAE
ncbi:MAG: 50S ribosomal protein L17 [Hyphomicrobiales bacterium]